jgi:thymidylate synthase (FAD)
MEIISRMYDKYKTFGIKNEDARFVLPNACETKIVHTANFREWRHIIGLRTSPHAQWEIRELCRLICVELNVIAPNIFGDLMEQF